jgi:hypothetical protein
MAQNERRRRYPELAPQQLRLVGVERRVADALEYRDGFGIDELGGLGPVARTDRGAIGIKRCADFRCVARLRGSAAAQRDQQERSNRNQPARHDTNMVTGASR